MTTQTQAGFDRPPCEPCRHENWFAIDVKVETIEWRRPWKLVALAVRLALLIIGAEMGIAPDWDISMSIA